MSNNIINFESYKKIGRNQPCPCGSGKKYKHCCYQKGIPVSLDEDVKSVIEINDPRRDSFSLDEDAKSVLEIDDPRLDEFKPFIKETPSSLYTCEDHNSIATILSALKYYNLSKIYVKKAIKKDPNYSGSYLNLAYLNLQTGNPEEAIKLLEKVPDGYYRKNRTSAEIILSLEGFEEAAHLFEKAVREEPDDNYSYLKLAQNNPLGSETRNYWIEL